MAVRGKASLPASRTRTIVNAMVFCSYIRRCRLRPLAVNQPPHFAVRIFVAQRGGQAMRTHVVKTLQHGKTPHRRRNADGGESRMPRRRKRPAVVHRRRNRDARGHLVVEQTADAHAQQRRELIVKRVVLAGACPSKCSRSDCLPAGRALPPPAAASRATTNSEALPNASVCNFSGDDQKCFSARAQQRVFKTITRRGSVLSAGDQLRARRLQRFHAFIQLPLHAGGKQRRRRRGFQLLFRTPR